jgi:oligopeptide transport system permease protein
MLRYTLIRTVWVFIILVTVLSINFILLKNAPEFPPTDPEQADIYYARQVADGYMTVVLERDPEMVQMLREKIRNPNNHPDLVLIRNARYVDEGAQFRIFTPVPLINQYFAWVRNIVLDWNWGVSTRVQANVPVYDVLLSRIPVTVRLNLVALFFYIPVGFALGIFAALRKDTVTDNVISVFVMILISLPSFVTMTFLVLIFGYGLGWLPAQFPPADVTGSIRYTAYILPVLGLSFGAVASLTRVSRSELTEVLTSEFLLLARTKGLSRTQAVLRHAMRNSMVPLVPGIIGSFVGLLSGSVIIEVIYSIPGTGRIFIRAMAQNNYDFNLILGITAFYTIISLFAILLVDLSYGLVDPRIRIGAKR